MPHFAVEANIHGGQYSEINAVSLNDSSFGHRDKLTTFQLYASSPTFGNPFPTDDGIPFVQGCVRDQSFRVVTNGSLRLPGCMTRSLMA